MNILLKTAIFITIALLLMPAVSMAKFTSELQQKIVSVQSNADGELLTQEGDSYIIHNEEIQLKAAAFVGKQARLLYLKMVNANVCVNIAPITAPPFVITTPPVTTTVQPR